MQEESVNKVILRGYVKKEPQIRYFSDANIKAYFPLLTFDLYKNSQESKRIPEYHNIIAWKKLAQKIENEIKEGQFIEVVGRIKTHSYEKNGEQKLSVQIVISSFEIIRENEKTSESTLSYPSSIESQKLDDLSDDLFSDNEDDILPF